MRLAAAAGNLSLLVQADTHEDARVIAQQDAVAAGHADAQVLWCVEYPPSIKRRPARAITDD